MDGLLRAWIDGAKRAILWRDTVQIESHVDELIRGNANFVCGVVNCDKASRRVVSGVHRAFGKRILRNDDDEILDTAIELRKFAGLLVLTPVRFLAALVAVAMVLR